MRLWLASIGSSTEAGGGDVHSRDAATPWTPDKWSGIKNTNFPEFMGEVLHLCKSKKNKHKMASRIILSLPGKNNPPCISSLTCIHEIKDPGRPTAVHLFMFMFYWCEQRELCPRKVNQSFSRLALTLRGVGFSHPFIPTLYSCRFLSLLWSHFPFSFLFSLDLTSLSLCGSFFVCVWLWWFHEESRDD